MFEKYRVKCTKAITEIPFFHGEPAQRNYLHFFKIIKTKYILRVNETKLTLRNAFILDLFALGGEKISKYNERTLFWGSLQKLDLSVNPQLRKTHIRVFPDYFSFRHFLVSSSYFLTLRLSSLTSLPVVHFLKQCVILFKERSSDRSFIFLTVLASLRRAA